MRIEILFEDEDLLCIQKPAGVVVNRAQNVKAQTIQDWMAKRLKSKTFVVDWQMLIPDDFSYDWGSPEEIFASRSGLVHRLDKDTSGCLLLAKHPGSLVAMLRAFRKRTVHKGYLALVHGQLQEDTEIVQAAIARHPRQSYRFSVQADGRQAETKFIVLERFTSFSKSYEQGFCLMRCIPKTGRTHQIRVHAAFRNCPLVGDHVYAGRKRSKLDKDWCPRQFLHAEKLSFMHPRTEKLVSIVAPLPEDLMQVLALLEVKEDRDD